MKKKLSPRFWVAIALVLCLISSVGACLVQTNGGSVEYHDLTFVTDSGHELDALLLVPETATAENPAPAIVVSHGWFNNREMQDLNYVEYARRGYVVIAISMYGHGDSEVIASNTWWDDENNANGLYDAVKYLSRLPYVDASRIGVTGHSNGALACREAVLQDEEGLIAAALLVSNDAVYTDENGSFYNMFGSRDAAIVACQYDEFFHRVYGADGSFTAPRDFLKQSTAQSFLYFGQDPAGLEAREAGVFYTEDIDGEEAIRAIYNPAITHPWAHFSKNVVSFSVDFFDQALGAPTALADNDQIWQWKAAFNALGVVGFFMFVVFCALALLDTPYFSSLKADKEVLPRPTLSGKGKRGYWIGQICCVLFAIIAYFVAFIVGYAVWQSSFWNQAPSRIIGLWCLLCGLFTLLVLRLSNKKGTVDKVERGIKIGWAKLGKTIVLALAVVCASFALVFLSDYLFLTDYRLWCFATIRAFSADHLTMILRFVPFWLVYYIVLSVAANCYNYFQVGKKSWVSVALQMFFVFLGPEIMVIVQYAVFFNTGYMVLDPMTGIMGIWLYPILVILPLATWICHKIYKKTNNPYIGGIIMGLIACILAVTNTLTG